METSIERRAISSDRRTCVYIGVYQRHLLKMADVGVVEFDQRSGEVIDSLQMTHVDVLAVILLDFLVVVSASRSLERRCSRLLTRAPASLSTDDRTAYADGSPSGSQVSFPGPFNTGAPFVWM